MLYCYTEFLYNDQAQTELDDNDSDDEQYISQLWWIDILEDSLKCSSVYKLGHDNHDLLEHVHRAIGALNNSMTYTRLMLLRRDIDVA